MACNICEATNYFNILNKVSIPIWTGSSEIEVAKFPCKISQCTECGHVYENISEELSKKLSDIYSFGHAFVSTPPSDQNWGFERAKAFLDRINYIDYSSAIEIGCADGYLLRFLEKQGYTKLIGVEPSLPKSSKIGNIEFIKAFASRDTILDRVDLIFANAVFEHIEDINSVLQFVKNNLKPTGELFFTVPNAEAELETGDAALFIHEHVHYYTKNSINYLLAKNGFKSKSIIQDRDAIYVSAIIDEKISLPSNPINIYSNYSNLLSIGLAKLSEIMISHNNIIIHGATNKLNNILGWVEDKYSFTLVDNDEVKLNQFFFGQKVKSIDDLNLTDYDCVVIVPTAYFNSIREQYLHLGFSGKIYQA
ncbi:MAG: class I SAM-dependent methyltransferase [Candidatus Neomarinimicrobiota bacterium]|nr:class I SAM-dependent methyltransferase [Candidatus Neomarinimicrobiota bacterium]